MVDTTTERNRSIVAWIEADPEVSYAKIGRHWNISREMVRKIATKHFRQADRFWTKDMHHASFTCKACGKTVLGVSLRRYCDKHENTGLRLGKKPAPDRRRACMTCGKPFQVKAHRLKTEAKRGNRIGVYCSNECRLNAMVVRPIKKRKPKP